MEKIDIEKLVEKEDEDFAKLIVKLAKAMMLDTMQQQEKEGGISLTTLIAQISAILELWEESRHQFIREEKKKSIFGLGKLAELFHPKGGESK